MTVRRVCAVGAELGEGPVWDSERGVLWFTDIKRRRIHRFVPESGRLDSWDAPAQPGWALPTDDGGLLVGLQTGLHRFDPDTGGFDFLIAPEPELPGNRLNDATVAADGSVWFGSMDDGEAAITGHVYRFDGTTVARQAIAALAITNGPAFSPDGGTLYHVDTLGGVVWAIAGGEARELIRMDVAEGYPDGPVVDAEGCIWIGLFGGWGVRRYAPEGRLIEQVALPVANVTKIAFGGDDLRTAYATTARKGLSAEALAAQPEAGDLFAFRVDVPGLPVPRARLTK